MNPKDLHHGSAFLGSLLERLTDLPSMILRNDGRILLFNDHTGKLGNLNGGSLEGSHVAELLPGKDRKQATEVFFGNSSRESTSVHTVVECDRGTTTDVLWNVLYASKNDEEGGIAVCTADASYDENLNSRLTKDRVKPEEEAKKYKTLFDYAYDAMIFSHFESGRIFEVNPEAENLLGYSSEQLLGKNLTDLFPSNDLSSLKRHLQEDKFFYKKEQKLMTSNGSRLTALMSASLVEYQGERTILSLFHDITERVELEKELRNRAERLEESKERLEELIHIISHDLKEPLRSIGTYSDILFSRLQGELEGDHYRRLEKLKENTTRLKRMLDNISNLTNITLRDSPTIIEVPELLDEVIGEIAPQSSAEIEVQPDFPSVKYDRFQLKVLLRNGLSNALRHNSPPVHVKIGCEKNPDESELTIFIEDNGHGIKEDHVEKVFGMFEQLDPEEDSEGMGAGLALCKRIVSSNGGEIYLDTEAGEGTTLYFTVPEAKD